MMPIATPETQRPAIIAATPLDAACKMAPMIVKRVDKTSVRRRPSFSSHQARDETADDHASRSHSHHGTLTGLDTCSVPAGNM